jgi:hypothetical protein
VNDAQLSSILDGVIQVRTLHGTRETHTDHARGIESVISALHSFTDIVRYLNTRRSSGAILDLTSESSVQDALYLMLRPWILDLTPENPTDKVANRYTIKDFVSHSARIVIEAKFVRSTDHGKSLAKEINDDIETYRYHASCDDLVFFIFDPEGHIPDAAALERHLRTSRSYDGRTLRCYGVIKP